MGRATLAAILAATSLSLAAEVRLSFEGARSVGKWEGFYRGTQLQGNGLSVRQGLTRPPAFLASTSFPYRARPFAEEVLFADRVSFVRFVGGWSRRWTWGESPRTGDLAYVENGKVRYRWELIGPRIDPYFKAGYREFIVALDNVPWDLAADPSEDAAYGQNSPPRDYREWREFIEELCRQLAARYGAAEVNTWSFRLGTEPTSRVTFRGSHADFVRWYDVTSAAVKKVLPRARFGPGEFAGGIAPDGPPEPAVNYVRLAEHCVAAGAPFDFLANSSHSIPRFNGDKLVGAASPADRVASNLSSYDNVLKRLGARAGETPIYVFQFGVLQSELQRDGRNLQTNEPGGRGAAWTFHVLTEMKARQPQLKGVWHWDAAERIVPEDPDSVLLYGNGWLYSVLDRLIGGDAWVLRTEPSPGGALHQALFASHGAERHLAVSAFHVSRAALPPETVRVTLPRRLLEPGASVAKWVQLTEGNSVFAAVKEDLRAQGLLAPGYRETPLLASVRTMSGAKGLAWAARQFPKYLRVQERSLTLDKFPGEVRCQGDDCEVRFEAPPNSVTVVAWGR